MNFNNRTWLPLAAAVVAALSLILASRTYFSHTPIAEPEVAIPGPAESFVEPVYPHIIAKRTSLYTSLKALNVTSQTIHQVVAAAKPVLDLSQLRAGTRFRLDYSPLNELVAIEFQLSPVEKLMIENKNGQWLAEKRQETVEVRTVTFKGVVQSSLWLSAEEAQMNPELIVQLAEIFAWEVDFAREVRPNDRWRLTVEQKQVRGKLIGWGSILAAEYENDGEKHTAVYFQEHGQSGYYSADGSNLRRMFLKSPIKYGRISSHFNRKRFHPIQKKTKPHLGVDYAAPTGTPIRAVGDGVILMAKWHGGGGKTIKIRHNSNYQTAYLHLSRFEKSIRTGVRVKQGQVIGYVGSTGMSTGPHLHFEFAHNGRVMDPLKQKFPSADPIPEQDLARFKAHATTLFASLPPWETVNIAESEKPKMSTEVTGEAATSERQ